MTQLAKCRNETLSAGPIESPHAVKSLGIWPTSSKFAFLQGGDWGGGISLVQKCYFPISVGVGGGWGGGNPNFFQLHLLSPKMLFSHFSWGGGGGLGKNLNLFQLHLLSPKILFSHFIVAGGGRIQTFPTLSPKSRNAIFSMGGGVITRTVRGDFLGVNVQILTTFCCCITDSLRAETNKPMQSRFVVVNACRVYFRVPTFFLWQNSLTFAVFDPFSPTF